MEEMAWSAFEATGNAPGISDDNKASLGRHDGSQSIILQIDCLFGFARSAK